VKVCSVSDVTSADVVVAVNWTGVVTDVVDARG
jgi:hypothetical protein